MFDDKRVISVTLPTDEAGMVGRKCPSAECGLYFKLKPGTGLPTDTCHCPYCGTAGEGPDFTTAEQLEYGTSIAIKRVMEPVTRGFQDSLKQLERRAPGSLIQFKVTTSPITFRVSRYFERDLETHVICDGCGLEFAVYGVFASCPDCQRLNALATCLASLNVAEKKLLLSENEELEAELRVALREDVLGSAVASFDAYGKALRRTHPRFLPAKAKPNLFQDLEGLAGALGEMAYPTLDSMVGPDALERLNWFFQARHVYSHNAGVVDERFLAKQPASTGRIGRKLVLPSERLRDGIHDLQRLASELDAIASGTKPPTVGPTP
ncbi:MAG: hypothetical protein IH609_17770 [Dehalococcoidia bacterium]|nr:hypothetical protein [Dehalococcoidia bacterium]